MRRPKPVFKTTEEKENGRREKDYKERWRPKVNKRTKKKVIQEKEHTRENENADSTQRKRKVSKNLPKKKCKTFAIWRGRERQIGSKVTVNKVTKRKRMIKKIYIERKQCDGKLKEI